MAFKRQEINLKLHKMQKMALESKAREVLFGGAAGGGKSFLMRIAAILWASQVPGIQIYLFRRLLPDLTKNHVEGPAGFRALLSPWTDQGFVKILEEEIRFKNGSKIYLCHCKDEKDRFKYQGAEIHVLLIDELTHFSEVIYRFLRSRVRATGLKLTPNIAHRFPRILCSSNPGNIGHHWVKETWIDPAAPMELWTAPKEDGGMSRQYVPARLADNPTLLEEDPDYEERLRGLGSPELVRAMLMGDWDVVSGAFFSEWTPKVILAPFSIPESWMKFLAFDFGSARPFSAGWWALSDGSVSHVPRGALVRFREWYGARSANVGLKMKVPEIAKGIVERTGHERLSYRVADPSIFKEEGGPSIAEEFHRNGVTFRRADNERKNGWQQLRNRLVGEDGKPMIYCFSTCRDSIRTIPAMMHDDHNIEDVNTDCEDHAGDEWRYAAMSRPYFPATVAAKIPPKTINEITFNELLECRPERSEHYF